MRRITKIDENEGTDHGDAICDQIVSNSAYGDYEPLTMADIWKILDALHTHLLDTKRDNRFLSKWMDELMKQHPEIEAW